MMTGSTARHTRPAYISTLAIIGLGLAALFLATVARHAVFGFGLEKRSLLESRADQIVLSARAWSERHADELASLQPVPLPIQDLIQEGIRGRLELQAKRTDDNKTIVECRLTLTRGRIRIRRELTWTVVADSEVPPLANGPS